MYTHGRTLMGTEQSREKRHVGRSEGRLLGFFSFGQFCATLICFAVVIELI